MAATAWQAYKSARKYLMTGDIDLDSHALRMTLHTSASNCTNLLLSSFAQLTHEVAELNGYSSSGVNVPYLLSTARRATSVWPSQSRYPFEPGAAVSRTSSTRCCGEIRHWAFFKSSSATPSSPLRGPAS